MDLDRHKLVEEREWRLRNYQDAVKRTVTVVVDAIQTETRRALEREIVYDDDMRREYTYADQAAAIQHAILQALHNADFRGLTRSAGELNAVEMAIFTLEKLRVSLPEAMQDELTDREDRGLHQRIDEKKSRVAELEAEKAAQCRAAVHQGGRGVGFHQCTKVGKKEFTVDARPGHLGEPPTEGADTTVVKLCTQHGKDAESGRRVHIYLPDAWTAKTQLAWRQQELREIEQMEARLPKELSSGT